METQSKLKTNLDTNLLKLVAVTSMVIDHVGHIFFHNIQSSAGSDAWPSPCSATAHLLVIFLMRLVLHI